MDTLAHKYASKLAAHGLCDPGAPLIGEIDADLVWNRQDVDCCVLEEVIGSLNINSILFSRPTEPYASILNTLTRESPPAIYPEDCETKTFLHDIPVTDRFDAETIIEALKRRKSIIVKDHGIATFGTVSPEQAFVVYSSVCFAGFVTLFTDHLRAVRRGESEPEREAIVRRTIDAYRGFLKTARDATALQRGPLESREDVIHAMIDAGKKTVECRMVDSFFGNISYRLDDTIFISQTGSSLDELAGCIDACPLDGSSCEGITSSSEYIAHRDIFAATPSRAILHGHPKFSMILSLICEKEACEFQGQCHRRCPEKRFIKDVPVVPGEVGTGPYGLYRTLPPAIAGRRGAIVYGHGLFSLGEHDYTDAFKHLTDIELMCVDEYCRLAGLKIESL